jgi:hypothetical protein
MLRPWFVLLKKQKRSSGVSDAGLIKIAVKSLGLDDLAPFNPRDKIIEYKFVKAYQFSATPEKEFSKLLEIPINDNYAESIGFFHEKKVEKF